MSESRYEKFRAEHGSERSAALYSFREIHQPANESDAAVPQHPILTSLLLAPVAATGSLEVIRLLPFAIGLTGLWFLAMTLVKQTSSILSALACFVPAAFCFPALPYQFLALPEIFLFTLSAIAFWNVCSAPREKISNFTPAIVCSCVAPLAHLRGLALFAATAISLICLLGRTSTRRQLLVIGSIFLAALIAAFVSNSFLSNWLGTVKDRPDFRMRPVLDMFVHYRHGLLPYAPIWVLAFSGLIAGLRVRKPWAVPALFFLVVFMIGSSHAIGESYPARFWVQAVPVLALCLSGFTESVMRTAVKAIIYLPLAALSLANTVVFILHPGLHLEARSGAAPYDFLVKILPSFDFGFWLDVPDSSLVRPGAICFCALVVSIVAVASIMRSNIMELAACLLLLVGFEAHRVTPVSITTAAETNAVVVRVRDTEAITRRPFRLRFQAPWKEVGPRPDESTRPVIEVVDGNVGWRMPIMSGSVLVHKSAAAVKDFSITLRWTDRDPMRIDPATPAADFEALACNSIFAGVW